MTTIKTLISTAVIALGLISCSKNEPAAPDNTSNQTAKTKFIEAGGTKYAYRELGNQSGTPVLMLSPLGSSLDDWDPAVTNGIAQNYKVILVDLDGVGASTGTTPNNIADMAKSATTFIKAMGLKKVNLLGFSLGSFIAQQIALTEPELINKMILTGTGPKGAVGLSNLTNLLAAGAGLTPEQNFLFFGFTKSDASIKAGTASWNRVHERTTDRDPAVSQESAGAAVQAVLGWAQPNAAALDELKQVTIPVLIAQGKEDLPVPVENAINMSQHLPNARLVVYPDAAHAALFQNADAFVKEVVGFLAQ